MIDPFFFFKFFLNFFRSPFQFLSFLIALSVNYVPQVTGFLYKLCTYNLFFLENNMYKLPAYNSCMIN